MAQAVGVRDVYTFAADPELARSLFPVQNLHVHRLGLTNVARRRWQWLLPLMPSAWRRLDLSDYDVILTSSHACVNAIRPSPGAIVISYCHTPMRYAWLWRDEIRRFPMPVQPFWPLAAAVFRRADRRWARRVHLFIANSRNVAERIRRFYNRPSLILRPPIDTRFWTPSRRALRRDFFLFVGRLVPYKRPDIAIRAAEAAGVPLVVAGAGPELPWLKRTAPPGVRFVENPSTEEIRQLYREARALLFPGIEDFGITMLEAQACGTPVIAVRAGGAREAVADGVTGVLYDDQSAASLAKALREFEPDGFSPRTMRRHVAEFDVELFDRRIREVVDAAVSVSSTGTPHGDLAARLSSDLNMELCAP